MKRLKLISIVSLLTLVLFTAGFDGCAKKAKDLAARALIAIMAAPERIEKLPLSPEQKAKAKVIVAAAGDAYKAYKDGKGTWAAFLVAFNGVVDLVPLNGWFGQFVSAIRDLLGIPANTSMMTAESVPEPNLKELKEEDVRALERLVGK